jgi:nicotinamide phosphoribosyltransferase
MQLQASTNSDGYKLGHADMYADGTTKVYSNLTPRTDKIYRQKATEFYDGKLVFFGAQGAIHEIAEMWDQSFFRVRKDKAIARFTKRVDAYLGEGVVTADRLAALHDLGYLPLEIKTLDEGTKVPMGIPVLTITNTIDDHFWLVNYLETVTSNLTWKGSTNATIAAEYKAILTSFAKKTGCFDTFGISIQAHDFSCRGMSGPEDAARSGAAPLAVGFVGTDTLSAIDYVEDYYNAEGLVALSVAATEHAVTSNNILSIEAALLDGTYKFITDRQKGIYDAMVLAGEELRLIAEVMFVYRLITVVVPTGIVSNVSDTYDFWSMMTRGYKYLKDVILSRADNAIGLAKVVVRPDSGDPVKVVCGYAEGQYRRTKDGIAYPLEAWDGAAYKGGYDAIPEYEIKGAIEVLWDIFGGEVNEAGYKVLDRHIGLIYGDSITTQRAVAILDGLEKKGFASCNVVFGVGSYTYQCNTRDTFGFAVKATFSVVNGQAVNIFKDPKTDSKKKSAKGLLMVDTDQDGEIVLVDQVDENLEKRGLLKTRFKDGQFVNQTTLDEVRQRLA